MMTTCSSWRPCAVQLLQRPTTSTRASAHGAMSRAASTMQVHGATFGALVQTSGVQIAQLAQGYWFDTQEDYWSIVWWLQACLLVEGMLQVMERHCTPSTRACSLLAGTLAPHPTHTGSNRHFMCTSLDILMSPAPPQRPANAALPDQRHRFLITPSKPLPSPRTPPPLPQTPRAAHSTGNLRRWWRPRMWCCASLMPATPRARAALMWSAMCAARALTRRWCC